MVGFCATLFPFILTNKKSSKHFLHIKVEIKKNYVIIIQKILDHIKVTSSQTGFAFELLRQNGTYIKYCTTRIFFDNVKFSLE